jgi:signal transduction histidine kinase
MTRDGAKAGRSLPAIWLPVMTISLTVLLFGLVLGLVSLRLRAELQRQIADRDAYGLTQMALMWGLADAAEAPVDPDSGLPAGIGSPELDALVQAERLKEMVGRMRGLLAARLFGADGALVLALPPGLTEHSLAPDDLAALRRFRPVSRYRRHSRREEFFPGDPVPAGALPSTWPVLEVTIPLRSPGQESLVGIAQLVLDGQSITTEFAALDRHLARQALGVFGVGCAILIVGLTWAFRRLQRANRLLRERTLGLLRANQELAMAARTSAVGAVTAHLIHGLKNPLSGLHQFVRGQGEGAASAGDALWTEAVRSTQRVQQILSEVTRVLQEEHGSAVYELSFAEFLEVVRSRVEKGAGAAGVGLRAYGAAPGTMTNREANLVILILENLVANAVEATRPGTQVELELTSTPHGIEFAVRDCGPGIPEELRVRLFKPVHSAKPHGTGLGLAISQQLAHHLGARLELRESTSQGSTFRLTLPRPQNSFDRAVARGSHSGESS